MKTERELRHELVDLENTDSHPQPNWAGSCALCHAIHTLRWVLDLEQDANLPYGEELVAREEK